MYIKLFGIWGIRAKSSTRTVGEKIRVVGGADYCFTGVEFSRSSLGRSAAWIAAIYNTPPHRARSNINDERVVRARHEMS